MYSRIKHFRLYSIEWDIEKIAILFCQSCQRNPNLRGLLICDASQSVIQQVSEQEQLKALWITAQRPVDLSPIGSMDNIKALLISAPGEEAGKFDWSFIEGMDQLETLYIERIKLNDLNFLKSEWLLPENYPYLSMLEVDDDILNTNREMLDSILPILDERDKEKEPKSQFFDHRLEFPVLLEYMQPVETYDD